jgi:hypothetical protein
MVTVIVDGQATQAVHLACDPLPGAYAGPTVLRVRWKNGDARLFDGSSVPIVFEFSGRLFGGNFRQVARTSESPDEVVCTLISEGPLEEVAERGARRFMRLFRWPRGGRSSTA